MAFDKFGPGGGLDQWSQQISNLMDEMLKRSYVSYRDCGAWQPALNLYQTPDAYVLCVELAGVEDERIEVRCIDDRRVMLAGAREQPRPDSVAHFSIFAMEIDEGRFRREIELPDAIDPDCVTREYVKGYLWIKLPRKARG